MQKIGRKGAACAVAGALLAMAWSSPAEADTVLSVDGDYVVAVGEDDIEPGYGFSLRGGPRLDLAILTLTTELVGNLRELGGSADPTIYEGKLGARLGVGAVVRPSVFAHLGVGHARFSRVYSDRTSFATDLGLGLDLTILPLINIGAQGAYNVLAGSPTLGWLSGGAHITLVLP